MAIRKDNDGHTFEIPEEMTRKFDALFNQYQTQVPESDAYYDAEETFNDTFWKYAKSS